MGGPGELGSTCPFCAERVGATDSFCESCGTELAPAVVSTASPGYTPECPVCSVDPSAPPGAISPDGYCESCGRKQPSGRDHTELDLGLLAGVTDKGLRHPRNEDAMALATAEAGGHPAALAVVCDGVSSSRRPDEASLAAVRAAAAVLLAGVREDADLAETSRAAVAAAQQALAGLDEPGP